MPRGGYRPGAGRPKGKEPKWMPKECVNEEAPPQTKEEIEEAAAAENMSPVDYMLKVMRDTSVPSDRRDRMAIAAAPYVCQKANEKVGKKVQQAEAAKEVGSGFFRPMQGPKVVGMKRG